MNNFYIENIWLFSVFMLPLPFVFILAPTLLVCSLILILLVRILILIMVFSSCNFLSNIMEEWVSMNCHFPTSLEDFIDGFTLFDFVFVPLADLFQKEKNWWHFIQHHCTIDSRGWEALLPNSTWIQNSQCRGIQFMHICQLKLCLYLINGLQQIWVWLKFVSYFNFTAYWVWMY